LNQDEMLDQLEQFEAGHDVNEAARLILDAIQNETTTPNALLNVLANLTAIAVSAINGMTSTEQATTVESVSNSLPELLGIYSTDTTSLYPTH
jgi:uncharacterized BrkB/YihY/UPF0761 family membrane protein